MKRSRYLFILNCAVLILVVQASLATPAPLAAAPFSQAGALVAPKPPGPVAPGAPQAASVSTGFTYQGQLSSGGSPYTGSCDFQLQLWDAPAGGAQIGSTQTVNSVDVDGGLFTLPVDFGPGAFLGDARWLELAVRCLASGDDFTPLSPRQALTAAPYAVYAATGGSLAHPGFTRTLLPGNEGWDASIAIGADGLALISYFNNTNADLRVVHCDNLACTRATTATLDSAGTVGDGASLAIGADGLGLISYVDVNNEALKVAHCSDTACSSATLATLDSAGTIGWRTALTIGSDGLGLIAYYDVALGDLKVAHCSDPACSSATLATLDSAGDVGLLASITIGADGLGLISYIKDAVQDRDLKVAHCSSVACSSATVSTVDSAGDVGWGSSLTTGADGLGLIAYQDQTDPANRRLKVAHCSDSLCSSATTATLDGDGSVAWGTSITVGPDGLGLIAYWNQVPYEARVAHCQDLACSSASRVVLGSSTATPSLTIGVDGLPLLATLTNNGSRMDLTVVHCSNAFCVPYFQRR
jgi:hypothetical protein